MINLFFYKDNFGDELSPYIIEKLTGQHVRFSWPFSFKLLGIHLLKFFKYCILLRPQTALYFMSFHKNTLIAIGSLLEHSTKYTTAWGTGMAQTNKKPKGGRFVLTRGRLSTDVIINAGFKVECEKGGDPALLLPIIYKPTNSVQKGKIGIICHNRDYNYISQMGLPSDVKLISLSECNIEKTIDEIVDCDCLFSTSLHGLIVSHAYGKKIVWVERESLPGGRFKFYDYLSSVGVESYEPIPLSMLKNESIYDVFINYAIQIDSSLIRCIQKTLLEKAPFDVLDKYKELVN